MKLFLTIAVAAFVIVCGYYLVKEANYQMAARQFETENMEGDLSDGGKTVAVVSYATDRCGIEIPRVLALATEQFERKHPSEAKAAKAEFMATMQDAGPLMALAEPLFCSVSQMGVNQLRATLRKKGLA